jgi:hypothetical protein
MTIQKFLNMIAQFLLNFNPLGEKGFSFNDSIKCNLNNSIGFDKFFALFFFSGFSANAGNTQDLTSV